MDGVRQEEVNSHAKTRSSRKEQLGIKGRENEKCQEEMKMGDDDDERKIKVRNKLDNKNGIIELTGDEGVKGKNIYSNETFIHGKASQLIVTRTIVHREARRLHCQR